MKEIQENCKQCGICCTKGGPALHIQDLHLIKSGKIPYSRLITVRKGELVLKPFNDTPVSANRELVKIIGTGKEWQCHYFNTTEMCCSIYKDRPLSCSTLKCWDTTEIEKIVEKETLTRFDIVGEDDPLFRLIEEHETRCPCPDMPELSIALAESRQIETDRYEKRVNLDIVIRTNAVRQFDLSLSEELFYFGRPIFQLLQQLKVKVIEEKGKLRLHWPL